MTGTLGSYITSSQAAVYKPYMVMVSCWELYSQNSFYEKLMTTENYELERLYNAGRNSQVTKFKSTFQHEVSYLKYKHGSDS